MTLLVEERVMKLEHSGATPEAEGVCVCVCVFAVRSLTRKIYVEVISFGEHIVSWKDNFKSQTLIIHMERKFEEDVNMSCVSRHAYKGIWVQRECFETAKSTKNERKILYSSHQQMILDMETLNRSKDMS